MSKATYQDANDYLITLQSNRLDIGQAQHILDNNPTLLARIRAAREEATVTKIEQETQVDVSPMGPSSGMGWTRCHGCESSFDDWGTGNHQPDCAGRCVRPECNWHAETA